MAACPVCNMNSLHRTWCGVYNAFICQTHCKGCPFKDRILSLSHCLYKTGVNKDGVF